MPGTAQGTARGRGAGHTREADPAQGLVTEGHVPDHTQDQDQGTGGLGPGQIQGHAAETVIQGIRMVTKMTEGSLS